MGGQTVEEGERKRVLLFQASWRQSSFVRGGSRILAEMHERNWVRWHSSQALLSCGMVVHDMGADGLANTVIPKLTGIGGIKPAEARLGWRRSWPPPPLFGCFEGHILVGIGAGWRDGCQLCDVRVHRVGTGRSRRRRFEMIGVHGSGAALLMDSRRTRHVSDGTYSSASRRMGG